MTRYAILTEIAELLTQQAQGYRDLAELSERKAAMEIVERDLLSVEEAQEEIEV